MKGGTFHGTIAGSYHIRANELVSVYQNYLKNYYLTTSSTN